MEHSPQENSRNLLALAEEAKEPPPLPTEGIPKQKVPGWIRWPIRALVLPFMILDLAAQRLVRFFFKTPYKQEGTCKQRGNCCYYIVIPEPKGMLSRLYYFWNTEINGFFLRREEPLEVESGRVMVMGCRYLQENGRCAHYRMRPAVCRKWPEIEYFGPPKILKGCGFRAVPRDKNFDPYNRQGKKEKSDTSVAS